MATSGSSASPYTFAATSGYRNDGDAGLTHVGARYYDAQVGRFITRDTVLDQHPYLYCDHEPVNALDPSGHDPLGLYAPLPMPNPLDLSQWHPRDDSLLPGPVIGTIPVPIGHGDWTILYHWDPSHPIQWPIIKYDKTWDWGSIGFAMPLDHPAQASINADLRISF